MISIQAISSTVKSLPQALIFSERVSSGIFWDILPIHEIYSQRRDKHYTLKENMWNLSQYMVHWGLTFMASVQITLHYKHSQSMIYMISQWYFCCLGMDCQGWYAELSVKLLVTRRPPRCENPWNFVHSPAGNLPWNVLFPPLLSPPFSLQIEWSYNPVGLTEADIWIFLDHPLGLPEPWE